MNRPVALAYYFIIALIFLSAACDEPPTNGGNGNIPTTMPQEHIPWPSLADSPWPMFMHDPQHTGRSPYEGPSQGEVNWEFQLGTEMFSNPVIDMEGNIVFTARSDQWGKAVLLSLTNTGDLNWKRELGGSIDSAPLITSDSLIYVTYSTSAAYLVQLDLEGNLRWTYEFEGLTGLSTRSPNISRDGRTIYVCGFDSALYAIRSDSTLQWKYSVAPAESMGEPVMSPDGNAIYFVDSNHKLYSIHKDGDLNWSLQLDDRWYINSPVVDSQGNIYNYSGSTFYSISPNGNIRWQYEGLSGAGGYLMGQTIGPDGTVYITTNNRFYAFDYAGNLKMTLIGSEDEVSIQNRPVVDIVGNTYLGILFSGPYEDWWNVNFVSFDPQGAIRYQIHLGDPLPGFVDIDSPACIDAAGNLYIGSDGGLSTQLFSIR